MLCEQIRSALNELAGCQDTDQGVSFATHCMYPSFEPVRISVSRVGSGFYVHDGGAAVQVVWDHGRDKAAAKRAVGRQAAIHSLQSTDGQLGVTVDSEEWLLSAILSVANVSAAVAAEMVDAPMARQAALADRVEDVIKGVVRPAQYVREYPARGRSGKTYTFDFAVQDAARQWVLLDTVVAHSASVSATYVAFADTKGRFRQGLAVYDAPLDESDASLLKQVADLVQFGSLSTGLRAEIGGG